MSISLPRPSHLCWACDKVCWREEGLLPLGQKTVICQRKIIVPRHEPTIDHDKLLVLADGFAWHCWKDKMEPIETEQPEYEYK